MITEDQLNAAAVKTRGSLERMLGVKDVVEAYQVGMEVYAGTPRPLCLDSGLDFITSHAGFAIGQKTGPKRYRRQLALCESCQLSDDDPELNICLQVALREGRKEGIWGGTMPRDRTGQYA